MNNKIYNEILQCVSKAAKSVLNEKAGVIEFDNKAYRDKICEIVKELKATEDYPDKLQYAPFKTLKFKKYTYDFTGIVSWLKCLDVYYAKIVDDFDAGALTTSEAEKNGLFIKDGDIRLGTIYVIDNGQHNLIHIMFHEMCHLYDHSLFKEIWMNDVAYFFAQHDSYDVNEFDLKTDIDKLSLNDIHNIITESMYYANFTEAHAFMENINFEIFDYLNRRKKLFYVAEDIEKIFYMSSKELYGIYILEKLIFKLKSINASVKDEYMTIYSEEIKKAYYNVNSFDKIISYIYKKLHKIVLHSRTLFDYYYNLDSTAKTLFELDESVKKIFMYSTNSECLGRRKS